ncbi:probable esterase OVCA2 [Coccomyxa sp. Obi]|nr:probable esterase OVCA2 [Coccomyxa sp. Obi]
MHRLELSQHPLHSNAAVNGQKLRLLGLHGFRTSGVILKQQMDFARLTKRLEDLVDIDYVDAPNQASGPLPEGFKTNIFKGPYYEWWNAKQDSQTQEVLIYEGWSHTLDFISQYMADNGPFDGFWAFSQGTILASLLLAMQEQGLVLQEHPLLKCTVCIGGARPGASVVEPLLAKTLRTPSLHIIGDTDYVKQWSHQLADTFVDPVVITHPKGHIVPALAGEKLQILRSFLMACQQDSAHQEPTITLSENGVVLV